MHTSTNIILTQTPYMINYWITNNITNGIVIKTNINITKSYKSKVKKS
jgi:hypothetical protein